MIATGLSPSLADPASSSPLITAASWIEAALLGTVATAVAVVCVATLGMLMFWGRLPVRRGALLVLGCFLLFGAPVIAAGLRAALGGGASTGVAPVEIAAPLPPPLPNPSPRAPAFDPYAGASMPLR